MKQDVIKLGKKVNIAMDGRFQLKVTTDPKKFAMTNINAFVPFGGKVEDRKRFMTPSGEVDSLMIDKISVILDPVKNEVDKVNVEVFIQHPEVRILGIPDEEYRELVRLKLKKANPKFTIVNIDKVKTVQYEKETELIEARYTLRNSKNPLSKDTLVFLCSRFGIAYRTHITDEERYRIDLINKLDKFISSDKIFENGKTQLQMFVECVDDIKNTEMYFYINELINLEIIQDIGGIYKIGNRPVGPNKESIINYYDSNVELFKEHKKLVLESMQGMITV